MGQRSTAEPWIGSVNGLSVEEGTMEGLNRGISRVLIWNEGPRWRGTEGGMPLMILGMKEVRASFIDAK